MLPYTCALWESLFRIRLGSGVTCLTLHSIPRDRQPVPQFMGIPAWFQRLLHGHQQIVLTHADACDAGPFKMSSCNLFWFLESRLWVSSCRPICLLPSLLNALLRLVFQESPVSWGLPSYSGPGLGSPGMWHFTRTCTHLLRGTKSWMLAHSVTDE